MHAGGEAGCVWNAPDPRPARPQGLLHDGRHQSRVTDHGTLRQGSRRRTAEQVLAVLSRESTLSTESELLGILVPLELR